MANHDSICSAAARAMNVSAFAHLGVIAAIVLLNPDGQAYEPVPFAFGVLVTICVSTGLLLLSHHVRRGRCIPGAIGLTAYVLASWVAGSAIANLADGIDLPIALRAAQLLLILILSWTIYRLTVSWRAGSR